MLERTYVVPYTEVADLDRAIEVQGQTKRGSPHDSLQSRVGSRENPEMYCSALASGQGRMTDRIEVAAVEPEWLSREGYYATAFDTPEAAHRFAEVIHVPVYVVRPQIFEAEGEELLTDLPPRARIFHVVHGLLSPQLGFDWPAGTVMVKSLRLSREVS